MLLFDYKNRSSLPKQIQQGESIYDFVDRIEKGDIQLSRAWLNRHFASIPNDAAVDLQRRIRAKNNTTSLSGFFELICYGKLIDLGYQPELISSAKPNSPDLAVSINEDKLYIECSIIEPATNHALHRFMCNTAQALGGAADWRLNIIEVEISSVTPSSKSFANYLLECWKLHPDHEHTWVDRDSDWMIVFSFIRMEFESPCESISGMGPCEVSYPDHVFIERMNRRLKKKNNQHKFAQSTIVNCIGWNDFGTLPSPDELPDLLNDLKSNPKEILWIPQAFPWSAHSCEIYLISRSSKSILTLSWNGKCVNRDV